MQPEDHPEKWAMFVHQQRFCNEYRNALGLPLVLHPAKLADQYALPQNGVETDSPAEEEEQTSEQMMIELDWD
ncbi:RNaseH domain-containing protein [Actinomadura viridis]|uniref:RNaseH domain-containing protein n=1 Tax=Actinomadura viridis TaxID=58110 RepID=UPI0036B17266